jgi:hypothetical protein
VKTADSLSGNVLSGATLGAAPNKRLVAKKSFAEGKYLANSVAVRSLACVIIHGHRSAIAQLKVQSFFVHAAPATLLVDAGVTERQQGFALS